MRVLVTGWAGYLGPHVVRLLKAKGHYVIGLDSGWFLPQYAEPPDYPDEAIFGDIRDGRPIWGGPQIDAVVHLAGLSNDPLGDMDEILTDEINFEGTIAMISEYAHARHVVASSCSVYGTAEIATEETEPAPLTAYARRKAMVDGLLARKDVSLRFGTLYGFSPGHRLDLVVNRMVWDATRARGITVFGNAARPLTHVEDAARAIVQAVESPLMRGIYNVGGENYRMQELATDVQRATGALVFKHPGGADARDYSVNSDKLLATGFEFKHTVKSALPDLIERTRTLPGLPTRYVRLNTIKSLIASGRLTADLKEKVA